MIKIAEIFARIALRGLKDKDGKPLFYHAQNVANRGNTEKEKIVGYLHDTIEDNVFVKKWLLQIIFGSEIADAVYILSKKKNQGYIEYIKLIKDNELARLVKLNDISHNSEIGRWPNKPKQYSDKLNSAREYLLS